MSSSDASEPNTTSPPSLKTIAQQALLDTLELDQIILSKSSPGHFSPDDLTSMPLAFFQQGIAAHAAVPITRALLDFLPQLEGRMTAIDHHHNSINCGDKPMSHEITKTSYLITTDDGDSRTLVIETAQGHFDTNYEGESWAGVSFRYTPGPVKARFLLDVPRGEDASSSLSSRNLGQLLRILAEDLQLPVTSSAESEAEEQRQASIQEETRARLRREDEAVRAPHRYDSTSSESGCRHYCSECYRSVKSLKIALRLLERPSIAYPLRKLQTLDAKQRDMTFGRLIRALLPHSFRNVSMYDIWHLEYLGEGDRDVENMLRQTAVAGWDLNE